VVATVVAATVVAATVVGTVAHNQRRNQAPLILLQH